MSTDRTMLSSWKEIAAFLHREVRTVQRWEMTRRLPVHRTPGAGRGLVYAFADELSGWLQSVTAADDGVPSIVFREVFMNAPEAMWLLDDTRRYREVNDVGCEMLGLTRDELLGRQIDEFAHEGERRALPLLWDRFVNARNLTGEFRFVTVGGEIIITSFLARADIVPGLHLGVFREHRRERLDVSSAA